jgi:PhoH-like ATPase
MKITHVTQDFEFNTFKELTSFDSFEKIYVLDTNIVLSDVKNVEILSQQSSNLIILPETMLDEIDSKKSGFEEINFMAREFGRLLESANVTQIIKTNEAVINRCVISANGVDTTIDIISKESYKCDEDRSTERNVLNDRKIIEVALFADEHYRAKASKASKVVFISLDVMCRQRALSLGLLTESFGKMNDFNPEFNKEFSIEEFNLESFPNSFEYLGEFEKFQTDIKKSISSISLYDKNGNKKYYVKSGCTFFLLDEKELEKQNIKPLNIQQKILSSLMLDNFNNVVVCEAAAGTGKTVTAISSAMKLIDQKMSPYDKIVYIRKTIISSDVELGFLPGSLEEKMMGYLAPLYSNLEAIVMRKFSSTKKKFTEDEMKDKILELISDYRITSMWQGHLRGTTIRNAIVIYDEIQNDNISDIRTTISRMGENCKVFCLGSLKQIDNRFVNRHTSALTFLLKKLNEDNEINIVGTNLTNSVRSKMAEWADGFK